METLAFKNAARVNTSWLAPWEKPALLWLAERMPARIGPDHLSALGLLAMLGAGLGYWLSRGNMLWLHFVNLMLFLNWFGDSLDGTLARARDCQRPRYGFYIDHMIDTFGAFFLLGGVALSGRMSVTIAMLTLVVYLMLAINSYLAAYTLGTFSISVGKFSPTELRLLLVIGNLTLFSHPRPKILGHKFPLFDIGGVVAIVLMLLILLILTGQNTARLYRAERV
jgi:phosphatidylglycerophosphate synthase